MYNKFIVIGFGVWGAGDTIKEAKDKFRKMGGKGQTTIYKCKSQLPFAPPNREAKQDEADAYITRYGELITIRCEYHKVSQ